MTTEILISLVEIMSMLTPSLRQGFEHFAGHAGMALHADADDGELADLFVGDDFAEADFLLQAVDDFLRLEQVRLVHGEGKVGGGRAAAVADVLHDHVHVDVGVADAP